MRVGWGVEYPGYSEGELEWLGWRRPVASHNGASALTEPLLHGLLVGSPKLV